jgi:uncharacterized protein (DUF433 family)
MKASDLISVDPDLLGGVPVLKGTRVPVRTLFGYIEDGYPLDGFLDCFPSVSREAALKVLACSEQALLGSLAAA